MKISLKCLLMTWIGLFPAVAFCAQDASSIGREKIEELISSMTLEEKIDFIGGYKNFNTRPIERLGIPMIRIADGPVGIRNFGPSTAYPASINLAATWDKRLAYNTGKALGMEAREKNIHMVLGPGVNIHRLPITGRNFEYMGEDPYLAGNLASEYIKGLQGEGVMGSIKHFAANNQEFDRNNVSSDVDERTLHEIYLPAFKTAVDEANVATVMTGYNPVNGIHMSQHDYLNNDVLKKQWRFSGFTISDWASTYDGVAAANGGLDLEMPAGAFMNKENLLPAIKSGVVKEKTIDEKVFRILSTYDRFGLLKNANLSSGFSLDKSFVRSVALDSARGGMVLLKNTGVLPINSEKIKRIAIIGPNGSPLVSGGGGSSYTTPEHPLSFVDAVKGFVSPKTKVSYEPGVFVGAPFPEGIWDDFPFYAYENGKKRNGVYAEFFNGKSLTGEKIFSRYYDRLKLEDGDLWNNPGVPKTQFSARFTSYFSPEKSGYYSLAGKGDDGYRILLDDVEVVNLWRNQGPTPGKVEVFLNAKQEYKVVTEYYNDGAGAVIYQGIKHVTLDVAPNQMIGNAVALAKDADLVLMPVGFSPATEGEAFDRTFKLPYDQDKLIKSVAAVNKNVVVVLNAGSNVDMSGWLDQIEGLLMAWYPGQEGNKAGVEILFGAINPSGKLPISFETALETNPAYPHYFDGDKDFRVTYGEGLFLGYRYWDTATEKPRFPFGFGLSYTRFSIGEIKSDKRKYSIEENILLSTVIENTGNMDGAEVIQVYVRDVKSSLPRPYKELKAFEKVYLKKGARKSLSFVLDPRDFAFYDPATKDWRLESGEFEIIVATSSETIHGTKLIDIK